MDHEFEILDMAPQAALAVRSKVPAADIPAKMVESFAEVWTFIAEKKALVAGPPFAMYHSWSGGEIDMEVGFPVAAAVEGGGRVQPMTLPGGKVACGLHIGPYDKLVDTYNALTAWMKAQGHIPAGRMWECYLSDPQIEKDPEKWMTRMYWPVE